MSTANEKILEHNICELTQQLYNSYNRITEQKSEIRDLKRIITALAEEISEQYKQG